MQIFSIMLQKRKNLGMNRIKELREDRDLRQMDVAQQVGTDYRTISNYETGKTNPDSFAIIKLADFFGVTCDYLLGVSERNIFNENDVISEIEEIKKRLEHIQKFLKRS